MQDLFDQEYVSENQDELNIAAGPSPSNCSNSSATGPRCVNGQLVRPEPPSDDSPSTACCSSSVTASGGVQLTKADPPCFGTPPGRCQEHGELHLAFSTLQTSAMRSIAYDLGRCGSLWRSMFTVGRARITRTLKLFWN